MKSATKALLSFTMLLLVGFTLLSEEGKMQGSEAQNSGLSDMTENEVNVNFTSLEQKSVIQFIERGKMTASWYGPRFHGRQTANGETYDQMAFTAAHKSLKFGTLLKLTNPKNNKTVIVRINDRGPYKGGRELDLSRGAAQALGMINNGVIKLRVEEVTLADDALPLVAIN